MLASFHIRAWAALRLALVFLLMITAAPIKQVTGLADQPSHPPRLVMTWKWGQGSGTEGVLNRPWSVVVDADGITYVADTYNNRIQKFDAQGNFLLAWGGFGSEPGQFFSPQAVALDRQGNLLVSDTLNWRIQRFSPQGEYLATITSPVGFYYHRQMAVDSAGNLYVADASNGRIQKFDATGAYLLSWQNSPCIYFTPAGMAFDAKGNLVVLNASCNLIEKYTAGGAFISSFRINSNETSIGQLSGLAIDADGRILAVDEYHHIVRVYSSGGELLKTFGTYGSEASQLNRPTSLALGPGGEIFIADTENNRVQVFDSEGNYRRMISGACTNCLQQPDGVAVNSAGLVYVADSGNNRVMVYDRHGKHQAVIGSAGSGPGQFYFPNGNDLEFDAQDHLYVSDSWNVRIQKFNPQGQHEFTWKPAVGYDIALDGAGGVYMAEQDNRVIHFDHQGQLVTSWGSAGSLPGQFDLPTAIETDLDGNVWVGDAFNRRVQKFNRHGRFLLEWAPEDAALSCFYPNDIAIDPLGRVNILDNAGQRIFVLDTAGAPIDEWSLAELTEGALGYAHGLTYDRWGNLYVTDGRDGQVFRFQLRPFNLTVSLLATSGSREQAYALLSANAPGNSDPYTYALVDGPGGEDNALFTLQANQLIFNGVLTDEPVAYHVRVRVTNSWGDPLVKALQVVTGSHIHLPVIQR